MYAGEGQDISVPLFFYVVWKNSTLPHLFHTTPREDVKTQDVINNIFIF